MPTHHLVVPSLAEAPPIRTKEPSSFDDFDFLPAVQFRAPETTVAALARLVKRDDASGKCKVGHFRVSETHVYVYQGGDHPDDEWLVYVDIRGCIAREQLPSQVGKTVAKYFTSKKVSWTNAAVDGLYRERLSEARAAAKKAEATVAAKRKTASKKVAKPSKKPLAKKPKSWPSRHSGAASPPPPAHRMSAAAKKPAARRPAAKKAAARKPAAKKPAAKKA